MLVLGQFEAVDLTHTLDGSAPTWTGGCGFSHEVKMDYDQGVRVLSYKCHAGVGTHMDAPSHFIKGGANMADIPLEQLIVPACVLDLSSKMHPDMFVMPEDILEYERKWGRIPENTLVLAYTGWEKYWKDSDRYRNADSSGKMHFPGFHVQTADLLLDRKIAGIGIDSLSPDGSNNKPANHFPVHEAILGAGRYIIENVAHLSKMPPCGAYALALPMKIAVGAEAAMRLVGLIPK
ncbi:MAG: cyclase family protein [Verrucomicrobia bacterium]|nr:cyclase family protein [Verrucomicrobiota bacterium]